VMSSSEWDKWKDEIHEKVSATIGECRVAKELFGRVYEDVAESDIGFVWRKGGEDTVETSPTGDRVTTLATPTLKWVDIAPIVVKASGDYRTWFEDRESYSIDPMLEEIGRRVSTMEITKLIGDLVGEAHEVKVDGNVLTKADMISAAASIRSHKHFPNTMVANPKEVQELLNKNEAVQKWGLPESLWSSKGRSLVGFVDGIDIHWVAEAPSGTYLLYDKGEVVARMGKVETYFEDRLATSLVVRHRCIAWAFDADALTRICLRQA